MKQEKVVSNSFILQYKDPRWQMKRLIIMQRDNFQCKACKSKDKTLNVHHKCTYRKDTKIWDYENDELTTLCEDCHKEISEYTGYSKNLIMDISYTVKRAKLINQIIESFDACYDEQLEMANAMISNLMQ